MNDYRNKLEKLTASLLVFKHMLKEGLINEKEYLEAHDHLKKKYCIKDKSIFVK